MNSRRIIRSPRRRALKEPGYFEPDRLRSLKIDRERKFDRSLYWQVTGPFAFQNTVDVRRRAPRLFQSIDVVGEESTCSNKISGSTSVGYAVADRQ